MAANQNKPDMSDKPAKTDLLTAIPEPTVQPHAVLTPGQKVKHANGATYIVRDVHKEGVALEGVANLVHPSQLSPL